MPYKSREAQRVAAHAYYLANRDQIRARTRARVIEHPLSPEERSAKMRAYRASHPEYRLRELAYNEAHRDDRRAKAFIYYGDNRDRRREAERARRAKLPAVVYLWMAPDGQADYVGRGTRTRALSHRSRDWFTPSHVLLTMTLDSEWEAMEFEGRWGGRYLPRHNKDGYRRSSQQGAPAA